MSTEGCHCSLNGVSDMGHNTLTLKLTICSKTSLAMSHFTFALTQWISMQSQNTKDQSTSGSHWSGRFCGLDEDWTQSPRLPDPLLHLREKPARLMWVVSQDVAPLGPISMLVIHWNLGERKRLSLNVLAFLLGSFTREQTRHCSFASKQQ